METSTLPTLVTPPSSPTNSPEDQTTPASTARFARRPPSDPTIEPDSLIYTPEKCLQLKQGFNNVNSTLGRVLVDAKDLLSSPVLSTDAPSLVPSYETPPTPNKSSIPSEKQRLAPRKILQYHQNMDGVMPPSETPSIVPPNSPSPTHNEPSKRTKRSRRRRTNHQKFYQLKLRKVQALESIDKSFKTLLQQPTNFISSPSKFPSTSNTSLTTPSLRRADKLFAQKKGSKEPFSADCRVTFSSTTISSSSKYVPPNKRSTSPPLKNSPAETSTQISPPLKSDPKSTSANTSPDSTDNLFHSVLTILLNGKEDAANKFAETFDNDFHTFLHRKPDDIDDAFQEISIRSNRTLTLRNRIRVLQFYYHAKVNGVVNIIEYNELSEKEIATWDNLNLEDDYNDKFQKSYNLLKELQQGPSGIGFFAASLHPIQDSPSDLENQNESSVSPNDSSSDIEDVSDISTADCQDSNASPDVPMETFKLEKIIDNLNDRYTSKYGNGRCNNFEFDHFRIWEEESSIDPDMDNMSCITGFDDCQSVDPDPYLDFPLEYIPYDPNSSHSKPISKSITHVANHLNSENESTSPIVNHLNVYHHFPSPSDKTDCQEETSNKSPSIVPQNDESSTELQDNSPATDSIPDNNSCSESDNLPDFTDHPENIHTNTELLQVVNNYIENNVSDSPEHSNDIDHNPVQTHLDMDNSIPVDGPFDNSNDPIDFNDHNDHSYYSDNDDNYQDDQGDY